MIRLDAATVLLQWAAGGLFFLWFTTRRREVGVGYGWLLRGTYLLLAARCRVVRVPVRRGAGARGQLASPWPRPRLFALVVSVVRRKAGVSGQTPSTTGAASGWRR